MCEPGQGSVEDCRTFQSSWRGRRAHGYLEVDLRVLPFSQMFARLVMSKLIATSPATEHPSHESRDVTTTYAYYSIIRDEFEFEQAHSSPLKARPT